jgi:hypothetical protein
MNGKRISAMAAALACWAMPVAAQEKPGTDAQMTDPFAAMAQMFSPEPLTAEQEARLPAAQIVVDRVMPPGTMGEVMESMYGGILGPIMAMANEPSASEVAKELGVESGWLDLTDEAAAEAAAILDPAWTERRKRQAAVMKQSMGEIMIAMEPAMRNAMAQAYAVHFTGQELADAAAFFATPSGAAYARKSYTIASDPRIMGAAMEGMPQMMSSFATMESAMKTATADLPEPRAYDDLSSDQRERLVELTGLSEEEIADGMARAVEAEAASDAHEPTDADAQF